MFWKNFSRQFGPGIIMASSCVGGSHIIASTQAGAYYGYQLAFFILLVNLLKYPFFRIAFDYSSVNNRTLLEGYAGKGRLYLYLFLVFNFFATIINIAGGTLLSAVLLGMLLPFNLPLNILNAATLASFLILLFSRQYHYLARPFDGFQQRHCRSCTRFHCYDAVDNNCHPFLCRPDGLDACSDGIKRFQLNVGY